MESPIEELKKKIGQDYFTISRVPKKTREWFFKFCNEEFEGDRGMALKHLIDFYTGILNAGTEHIEMAILDHDKRLAFLEETAGNKKEEKRSRLAPPKEE